MRSALCFLNYREWLSIIFRYQVCGFRVYESAVNSANFESLATSIDVERIFSRGRLLLSHTRSRLSMQTTRAVLCVGQWCVQKLVKTEDVVAVSKLNDEEGDEEEMEDGWDMIKIE